MLPINIFAWSSKADLVFDEMATTDHLNDEIRALQKKVDEWEMQLTNLLNEGIEGMNTEQKQFMVKYLSDRILEKDKLIAAKEIEKDKLITITKETDAAKEIENEKRITEKEKQITADKQYRLERGEITASPILYIYFIYKIILRLLLASFVKSAGFRMSLRQVCSQLFGPPLQHSQVGFSTGSGPTSSQRPTQTCPTDYTYSSISSRTVPSFRTGSSSTSPSSDSDFGMEMQNREARKNANHSSLRHRIKDRGLGGAGGNV